MNEKTLAEFVIALHDQSKSLADFKSKLNENGAPFPDSVIENMDRLILSMHPKHKKSRKNAANGALGEKAASNDNDKKSRLFPSLSLPDQEWQPSPLSKPSEEKDAVNKEVDDLMSQLESVSKKARPRASEFMGDDDKERSTKRQRRDERSPPSRRSRSPPRRGGNDSYRGRYDDGPRGRPSGRREQTMDDRPVLYKIYTGRVSSLKEFGAFVTLEGVKGRVDGKYYLPFEWWRSSKLLLGLVHVSAIQQGARVNSAADLLQRGQEVKVKVMSVAATRVSLSMKDVDQVTGRDLTPHLRIKSEAEMVEEERLRASSGSNAVPMGGSGVPTESSAPVRSARRLTSPERWEIKQLISSGVIDASEYPDLDEDFGNPMAHAEVEEELDIEVREDEPSFLAGQTKRTLNLSPVKIIKAPDGSMNRAALAGASLAKERRELRQQEANDKADSEARDFSAPWLDPMASEQDRMFAQDMRGNAAGQSFTSQWKEQTFNKATTFGKITSLSIQDQRKSLPIYKLRDQLLKAIRDVCPNLLVLIYC